MHRLSTCSWSEEWVVDPFRNAAQRFGHALSSGCRECGGNGPAVLTFLLVRSTFPGCGHDFRRRHERASDSGAHVPRLCPARAGTRPGRADRRPRPGRRGRPASAGAAALRPPARRFAHGRRPHRPASLGAAGPDGAYDARAAGRRRAGARTRSRRWALGLLRRAALWGSGAQGEYLAWRVAPPVADPVAAARRSARVRSVVRRLVMWGSGPGGKYLAWGGPAFPDPRRDVDRPVVLRELPSTPTFQPAAPSPAAALPPHGPASAGSRWMPPVPRGAVAVPGVRPSGPPERSRATGWPVQSPVSPVATGLVQARGDPLSCPVRGSPLPARRSRSPGSTWSSFP
jgi:hypothetical protein